MPRVGKTMDRKASARRQAEAGANTCKRCDKPGHEARYCKAKWWTSWPGKPAMMLGIKTPDGCRMELTIVLSEATYQQALALWKAACEDTETRG